MTRFNIVLLIFALFALFIIIGGALFLRSDFLLERIRIVLEQQLEKEFRTEVSIGQMQGNVLTGLSARDIEVADVAPDSDGPMIVVQEAAIRYELLYLLLGRFVVDQITLKQPQVHTHIDSDGQTNLSRLVEARREAPTNTKSPLFSWRVATVRVQDALFSLHDETRDLNLTVDGIDMSLVGPLHRWEHQGRISFHDGTLELNGVRKTIRELSTEFKVQNGLGELTEFTLKMGNSVVRLRGTVRNFQRFLLAGRLESALDLADASEFWRAGSQVEGVANLELEAAGTLEEIAGNLSISLPQGRFSKLRFDNLRIKASFDPRGLHIQNLTAEIAGGTLSGEVTVTPQAKDVFYTGTLRLSGVESDPWLRMLYEWPSQLRTFGGAMQIESRFNGFLSDAGTLNLSGTADWEDPSLNGIAFGPSSAKFRVRGDRLLAEGQLDGGAFQLAGNLGFVRPFQIRHVFEAFQVGHWTKALDLPDLTGEARITVRMQEGWPHTEVLFDLPEAVLYRVPIGRLEGKARLIGDQLYLDQVSMRHATGSRGTLVGTARLTDEFPLDIRIALSNLDLAHYIQITGTAHPIEGRAEGKIHLEGPLEDLTGTGSFSVVDGNAWGLPINPLQIQVNVSESIFRIPVTPLVTSGQEGKFDLSVSLDQVFHVHVETKDCELSALRVPFDINWPLDALVDARVISDGDGHTSSLSIEASTDALYFAGELLGSAHVSGQLQEDGRVHLEGTGLADTVTLDMLIGESQQVASHESKDPRPETGRLESSGLTDPRPAQSESIHRSESSPFELTFDFEQARLEPFIASLHQPSLGHFRGWATGSFTSQGDLMRPEAIQSEFIVQTYELNGQQRYANPAPVRLTLDGPHTSIDSLQVTLAGTTEPLLSVTGGFSDQEVDVHFEGGRVPTSVFADLLGRSIMLLGDADISGTVSGTREDPTLNVTWQIPDLAVPLQLADFPGAHPNFPDLEISLQDIRGGCVLTSQRISLDTTASVEKNRVHLSGDWPMRPDGPEHSGSLRLDFEATELGFLQAFSHHFPQYPAIQQVQGEIVGSLLLTGTRNDLRLSGDVTGNRMFLRLLGWPQTLDQGQFQIHLASDETFQISLEHATAMIDDAPVALQLAAQYPTGLISLLDTPRFWEQTHVSAVLDATNYNLTWAAAHLAQDINLPVAGEISLHAALEGIGLAPEGYRGGVEVSRIDLQVGEHTVQNQRPIRLRLKPGHLLFDDFTLFQNEAPFSISGEVDFARQRADLTVDAEQIDLSMLTPFVALPYSLRGLMSFDLQVSGSLDAPLMHATWALRGIGMQAAQLDALVGEVDYADRLLTLKRTQISGYGNQGVLYGDLPIDLALRRLPARQRLLDQPMQVTIEGNQVDLGFLASFSRLVKRAEGRADLRLRLLGTSARPYLDGYLTVQDGTVQLDRFDVLLTAGEFRMQAKQGQIQFDRIAFQIGKGRYAGDGTLQLQGLIPQGFVGRFRGEHAQMADIARNFLPSRIAQKLGGEVTFDTDLSLDLAAWSEDVRQRNVSVLDPTAVIQYATGALRLEDIRVRFDESEIQNIGAASGQPEPVELRFKEQTLSVAGCRLRDASHQRFQLDLKNQKIWELGRAIRLDATGSFTEALVADFLPKMPVIRGQMAYHLKVRGNEREPVIDFDWTFPELWINDAALDRFEGQVHYSKGMLVVRNTRPIQAAIGRNRLNLTARVPMRILPIEAKWELLPGGSQIELNAQLPELGFVALLHPSIAYASGNAEVSLTVGGDIHRPGLSGLVQLQDGHVGLADVNIELSNVRGQMEISEEQLRIGDVRGSLNDGTFGMRGSISLQDYRPSVLHLTGELQDCTFSEEGIYEFTCRTEPNGLRLEGPLSRPTLGQSLTIVGGRYEQPWEQLAQSWFAYKSEAQSAVRYDAPLLRNLVLDLSIEAPDKLRLDTQGLVDIEARVSGRLVGPLNSPVYVGDVYITDGEFYFMEHVFQLDREEQGVISNRDETLFNPSYRIAAESIVPSVDIYDLDGNLLTKDVRIKVDLTGRLLQPAPPNFEVEVLQPEGKQFVELDSQQAFWLLTIGRPAPINADGTLAFAETAPNLFSKGQRYVFSRIGRAIGLQALQVDVDRDAFEASRILFTKEFTPRWIVTYSSSLHEEPSIEVEYRLNDRISISTERNERGQFGVDLKLEHEFD